MTTRTLTLQQQTRFAINILIEDDTGTLACSIFLVTRMLMVIGQVGRWLVATRTEVSSFLADVTTALDFTGKVLVIGFNSLAFGLGVTL